MSPKLLDRPRIPRPDDQLLINTICTSIRRGHSQRATAAFAGIAKDTLRSWLARGREQLAQADMDAGAEELDDEGLPELGSHAVFAAHVERAYADWEAKMVSRMDEAGLKPHHWPANMARLRSLYPEEWAEKREIKVEQRTVTVNITGQLSERTKQKLLEVAAREAQLKLSAP